MMQVRRICWGTLIFIVPKHIWTSIPINWSPAMPISHTCHRAETEHSMSVVICRRPAPLHAIGPPVRCALTVVPSVVQEGEVA